MTSMTALAPVAASHSAAGIAIAPGKAKRPVPPPSLLHQPAIIVLGRDDSGKPHASWFDETEQKLAAKAAALMGMRTITVADEAVKALAARLPHGRVFASGKAFVPFVKETLFGELSAHVSEGGADTDGRDSNAEADAPATDESRGDDGMANPGGASTLDEAEPASVDATEPVRGTPAPAGKAKRTKANGSAVAGKTTAGRAGAAHGAAEGAPTAQAANGGVGEPAGADPAANAAIAADWSKIAAGSLVLASEGEGHGWYECVVEEVREADLFILVWRDWPEEPPLVRRSKHIALLNPAYEPL